MIRISKLVGFFIDILEDLYNITQRQNHHRSSYFEIILYQ